MLRQPFAHLLAPGLQAARRAHRDFKFDHLPVCVKADQIDSFELFVPYVGAELKHDIQAVGAGEIALLAEVLAYIEYRVQNQCDRRCRLVGHKGHRRAEHRVRVQDGRQRAKVVLGNHAVS